VPQRLAKARKMACPKKKTAVTKNRISRQLRETIKMKFDVLESLSHTRVTTKYDIISLLMLSRPFFI
jgi:ribonuclease P protein component